MTASTWIILAIICGAVEIFTAGFWFLWLAIAGLVTAAGTSVGWLSSLQSQLLVFAIIALLLIIFTRPLVMKAIKSSDIASNIDALIGQHGVVLEPIAPMHFGQVKLNGEIWTAAAQSEIETGSTVVVRAIDGVKLIVEPVQ
ncbi:MAG: NfeD family protein [Syntrophomonadaceae bacterium]|nr:NfeD family protein [Syntrophomonadaceae bacterium]